MTEETTDKSEAAQETLNTVKSALESGEDIETVVKDAVLLAFNSGGAVLGQLKDLTRDVLNTAVETTENLTSEERSRLLEQTVTGLGEAIGSAVQATDLALKEARSKGEKFAREDLSAAMSELETIEKLFVETVTRISESSGSALASSAGDLAGHASRIAEGLKPSLESAITLLKEHPTELAESATSVIAGAFSGALKGVSAALAEKSKK